MAKEPGDFEGRIRFWLRNTKMTEYNVSKAMVKMFIAEAGELEVGRVIGSEGTL